MKKGYLPHIHALRGLAILVIVGIHCRISFGWGTNFVEQKLFQVLLDNGTVIFVFIAGFLFQYLNHDRFNYPDYLKRKAKFVLLPYLIVSVIPVLEKLYFQEAIPWMPKWLTTQPVVLQAGYILLVGKQFGPFWFIPMITIFYLISPLLIYIDKKNLYPFLIPVFVVGLFTYQFGYYSNTFDSFVNFFPVYLFGMWSARNQDRITGLGLKLVWPLCLVYLGVFYFEFVGVFPIHKLRSFFPSPEVPYWAFNYSKLKVSLLCLILINFFFLIKDKRMKMLDVLADYSFGVFFLHLYFIVAAQKIAHAYFPDFTLNTLTFFIYLILVTLACVCLVWLLKKAVGAKSRYIVGS